MAKARLTKNALVLPKEWLDKLRDDIEVKQAKGVVISESKQRIQARQRLAAMTRKLRQAGTARGMPSGEEVEADVDAVRTARARGR